MLEISNIAAGVPFYLNNVRNDFVTTHYKTMHASNLTSTG